MTFNWIDYLNLAVQLEKDAKSDSSLGEAKLRTSISRAYYSSFNLAKKYLRENGETLSKGAEVHKEIQSIFEGLSLQEMDENRKKNLIEISNVLGILRSSRNKSDYDSTVSGIDKLAEASIIRAQRLEALVQEL